MTLTCYECKGTFTSRQGLGRHLKIAHGPPLFLHCGHCSYQDKRRDNLKRHYKSCHPNHLTEYSTIRTKVGEKREGGIRMPVSINKRLGRLARESAVRSPVAAAACKAPVSPGPQSPTREAVLSLSPTPISPLVARLSPIVKLTGKARSMLDLMKKPVSPSRDSSTPDSMPPLSPVTVACDEQAGTDDEATEEPPAKRMKMATVEEKVFRNTYLDGKLVHQENTQRAFLKPVVASLYTLDA